MLKLFNKNSIQCPGGLCEETNAGCNEKRLKVRPKLTKFPKFTDFSRFYATFVKFSRDFMDKNVEENLLSSSRVVRGAKCQFLVFCNVTFL